METAAAAILSNLPAILLLIVGFVLVVVEMYLPGFGVPGISGIICLVAGVWLKAKSAMEALVLVAVIIVLLCIALTVAIHSVAKGKLAKSKLVLHETSRSEGIDANDLSFYVGKTGTALTTLRPAGMGSFDGVKLNVVSDGEFLPAGAEIQVVAVEGNRIVVAPRI